MPRSATAVLLAADADGHPIVSVHAKKTYAFNAQGTCTLAEEQAPLFLPRAQPVAPWHAESDVIPFKRSTDVIVHAVAYGSGAASCVAGISVAGRKVAYRVSGDRRCSYSGPGSLRFSPPEPFDAIPICYERAYGGLDETEPAPAPTIPAEYFRRHPGAYPRNTVGRGYVVRERREALEGLLLPNIEHPDQLLTPENLVAGAPELWWRQPLPWSCDWFDASWYPRSSFFGGPPYDFPADDHDVAEVRLGWVDAGQKERAQHLSVEQLVDGRFFDAASPSLVVPFLSAREQVELTGMTRSGRLVVELPGASPRIAVRFEGKTHEVVPVPNRLLISVEEDRLSLVWHGAWRTLDKLQHRSALEAEAGTVKLEGVEAFVDGVLVSPGLG